MELRILKIALWPRKKNLLPRELAFDPSAVNVITGASRTGKSAVIPIVDYCLGADKCAIPVGRIRESCEWFGVVLQTATGQLLIARREPGEQKSTGDAFTLEAEEIQIPPSIVKNTSIDIVKARLDDLSGLTSLRFDTGDDIPFFDRPSFRDLAAFTFQAQNVVANPDVMFYKADTYEHREKLRNILPYVLGVVTPELLARQHQLADLRKRLRRRDRELSNAKDVTARWLAELRVTVSQAQELGLLDSEIDISDVDKTVRTLRRIIKQIPGTRASASSVSTIGAQIEQWKGQEEDLSLELANLRQRFVEMSNLRSASGAFRRSVHLQHERLEVSRFVAALQESHNRCPVCGSDELRHKEEIDDLVQQLRSIESSAADFQILPATFDREFERVRSRIESVTEKLDAVRLQINKLQDFDEEQRKRRYTERNIFRFIGNLESDLKIFESVSADSALVTEISELRARIIELERDVSETSLEDRKRRALNSVSTIASRYVPLLDVEKPDDRLLLSLSDLSVKVEGPTRDDYLWEIGSGSNWVSYHVATSLALQLHFLKQDENPTPNFLVFDQPSQVYFPKKLADQFDIPDLDPKLSDADVVAVRKIFNVLSRATVDSQNQLQIIVLDHAPESVWFGLPNIKLIEEWRGEGGKLIPEAWY